MSLSPNAQFNLQSTGSNNGLWGVNLNSNFSIIDGIYGGRVSVSCAGSSNITISTSQAQNLFQILTGALTGNILYILPATGGFFFVTNNTTGAYTVTVVNTALGTGVAVPQGTSQLLFSNPDNTTVAGILPTALSLSSLSLSGQLTSTLATGTAPFVVSSTTAVANLSIGGHAASATTVTGLTVAGGKTLTVNNSLTLNGTDSTAMTFPGTSDTVSTLAATQTLSNKRLVPRVLTITSSATPSINTDNYNAVNITALATAITSMSSSLTGTPNNFDKIIFRILDNGVARAITWGASFAQAGASLPTITTPNKLLTVGFIYDSVAAVWECVALAQQT